MEVFHSKSETFNIKFLHIRRLLAIMMGIPSEKMQGGVTMNHDTVQNLIAMIGYMVFSLLNLVLMWTNVIPSNMMFGLHSEPSFLFGIPWGIIIGVFVVLMAAYSLVLDFDRVQQGVRNGAPRKYGWLSAFGIMVTVVWCTSRSCASSRSCEAATSSRSTESPARHRTRRAFGIPARHVG